MTFSEALMCSAGAGVARQTLHLLTGEEGAWFVEICVFYGFRAHVFWPLPRRPKAAILASCGQEAGIPRVGHGTSNSEPTAFLGSSTIPSRVLRLFVNFLETCLHGA